MNKEGKEIKRQKCQIRTRVMGYLRPIMSANIGKRSEFFSRKNFNVKDIENNETLIKRQNAEFVKQYGGNKDI